MILASFPLLGNSFEYLQPVVLKAVGQNKLICIKQFPKSKMFYSPFLSSMARKVKKLQSKFH